MDSRDSGFANLLISVIGRIGDRLGMLAACYFHTDCSRMMSTFRQTFRRRVADDTSRIVASAGKWRLLHALTVNAQLKTDDAMLPRFAMRMM
jgi:hypothetical protein